MVDAEWAVEALEPCYDNVFTLRQLIETCVGSDDAEKLDPVIDRVIIGINNRIEEVPNKHVTNFRHYLWMLSSNKQQVPRRDVEKFLSIAIFDVVQNKIGSGKLLHLLQHGCWFEIIGEKSIVQRTGERLDFTISDPSFVFRPRSRLSSTGQECNPMFEQMPKRKKKRKKSPGTSKMIARKSIMYSRAIPWKKQVDGESETRSQSQAGLIHEMEQIFSFPSFLRLAKNNSFKSIMAEVKRNHERCFLKSLVDKCCPLKCSVSCRVMVQLLKDVKSPESVCELMRRILFFVFPKKLFGSCGNRDKMYRLLKLIVVSGYNVQLEAKNFIRGIDLKTVTWLSHLPQELQKKTFEEIAFWICNYLISSLKCYFYVTETKCDKSKLHFYRKETWKRICELEIERQVAGKVLNLLTRPSQNMYLELSGFCCSGVRFVPKKDSVRMINRLYKPPDSPGLYARELKGLKSLLLLLKDDQKCVSNRQWFPEVIRELKERQGNDSDGNVYFIRADIKHCYPSIKHDVLIEMIEKRIKRLFGALPSALTVQLYNFLAVKNFVYKRRPEFVIVHPKLPHRAPGVRNSVTIVGESFQLDAPLEKIKMYIDDAVIKFGNKMYRMKQGIRQGALLSADLCTLYMESFVNESFNSIGADEDHILVEADDLIILTDSYEKAQSYLQVLLNGSSKHNLQLNLDKLRVNFLVPSLKDKNISNDLVFFSYCFNTYDQQLTCDYLPYAGKDIKYSFACNPFVSSEKMVKKLIRQLTFPHQLMDPKINSTETLIRNLYERVYLQSLRMASFVLARDQHHITCNPTHLSSFLVGIVRKIKRLNRSWSRAKSTELSEEEITLTCIHALRSVWTIGKLRFRSQDVDLIDNMAGHLHSISTDRQRLRKWCEIFEEYPKYPFNRIILS